MANKNDLTIKSSYSRIYVELISPLVISVIVSLQKRHPILFLICISHLFVFLTQRKNQVRESSERKAEKKERMFHHPKKLPSSMNPNERTNTSMCVQNDSGLVLTTDPKPRLRWTVELHERFVDAVTQLGGPDSTYFIPISF